MQFIFDGEIYKIVKITGPTHDMLGLSLTENNSTKNNIEAMPLSIKKDEIYNANASEVKEQVLIAIDEINSKFGIKYKVKKIQFVPSDTPAANIYKELVIELISHIIKKGKFIQT
jgi:hypothetical protein